MPARETGGLSGLAWPDALPGVVGCSVSPSGPTSADPATGPASPAGRRARRGCPAARLVRVPVSNARQPARRGPLPLAVSLARLAGLGRRWVAGLLPGPHDR